MHSDVQSCTYLVITCITLEPFVLQLKCWVGWLHTVGKVSGMEIWEEGYEALSCRLQSTAQSCGGLWHVGLADSIE